MGSQNGQTTHRITLTSFAGFICPYCGNFNLIHLV